MTHDNEIRLHELFTAFQEQDIAKIETLVRPDAVWHFPGTSAGLSGSYTGLAGILEFFGKVQTLTAGSFKLELEDILANDSFGVAFFRGKGERPNKDTPLNNPTCLKFQFVDGKIAEVWEFVWDLYAVDEFWS